MKRDKYLQIFNYLREFSKIRSNPVRDIQNSPSQYPEILWFADFPKYEEFECVTNKGFSNDADYWIKIVKPQEPAAPVYPILNFSDNLNKWIVKESLLNETGLPVLYDSLMVLNENYIEPEEVEEEEIHEIVIEDITDELNAFDSFSLEENIEDVINEEIIIEDLKVEPEIESVIVEDEGIEDNLKEGINLDEITLEDGELDLDFEIEEEAESVEKVNTWDYELTILLAEFPEVIDEFEDYVTNRWENEFGKYKTDLKNYKELHKKYSSLYATYKQLFSMHNKSKQFGEEFELVMGIGLLYFKETAHAPIICRHLLTSNAEIVFDVLENSSSLIVNPSLDNEIQIETDAIMDLFDQFDSTNLIEIEKLAKAFLVENDLADGLFDVQLKEVLQEMAARLRPDSFFHDEIEVSKKVPSKPIISFSPALILRKRNTRSFTALYEKIIEDLTLEEIDIDIPAINDLIELEYNPREFTNAIVDYTIKTEVDNTVYFPKKYNDEQIEIIEKARVNSKVLVQGPPGTGKSHTIANLICHLLANGNKVLVTAYTKRALEVLKDKLPEEFRNLTVNLLSSDSSSIHDLQLSVNSIIEELTKGNLNEYKYNIAKYSLDLKNLIEEKKTTNEELLKMKEHSMGERILNEFYKGTLTEIAELLEKDDKEFHWFKDEIKDLNDIILIPDIFEFIKLNDKYKNLDIDTVNHKLPNKEYIVSPNELIDYKYYIDNLDLDNEYQSLNINLNRISLPSLMARLNDFKNILEEIESLQLPFKSKLFEDYLRYNSFIWTQRIQQTNELLKGINEEELINFDRNIEIKYPADKSIIQLKTEAVALLEFLNEGNPLSGPAFLLKKAFLPELIKKKISFVDTVKVNGVNCDTSEEFQMVIKDLQFKQVFAELFKMWDITHVFNSYSESFVYIKQMYESAVGLMTLLGNAKNIKGEIEIVYSIKIASFNIIETNTLINSINYSLKLGNNKKMGENIANTIKYLSTTPDLHPLTINLIESLNDLDSVRYQRLIAELDEIANTRTSYNHFILQEDKLKKHFPYLIEEIITDTFDYTHKDLIEKAICFKHTKLEFSLLVNESKENELIRRVFELEIEEEKIIELLASQKSWLHVLESLTENKALRKHLEAWVQAVKKIGKRGIGKRALRFRKIAQQQMDKCKDSVPCWIMPLYKVAETIQPVKGMYDYVIIDEASQLGPDAIFLLYISKNIIIVGDDKQTSPEYVGVDANIMQPHIKRHLQGIPFNEFFGTEFSFFDLGKRFCDGITVLREHFRCMPEIIEFSNKYFYQPDGKGLYPLRQYSENRLEPLKNVFCDDGFVENKGQHIINPAEADRIAFTISELIKSDYYKDKTFGVICLQGNSQGALIESILLKTIGELEFYNRKIICGNSASFQGDERDIIFLSLITAPNHKRSALTRAEDERRFNVAVSRAKDQIWLFHSVELNDLRNTNDLRYKVLDHFLNYKSKAIPLQNIIEKTYTKLPEHFHSNFQVDVFNDIIAQGYNVVPAYEVARGKYVIDLVAVLDNGVKIAVECDGDKWQGAEYFKKNLNKQKVLERCGWQFFRLRGVDYYNNRVKSLEPLWTLIEASNTEAVNYDILYESIDYSERLLQLEKDKNNEEIIIQTPEEIEQQKKQEEYYYKNFLMLD
ncbi:MAG: AAA domain-containing protein [Bacteroidota bacterium]